jgi:hypothetical protein
LATLPLAVIWKKHMLDHMLPFYPAKNILATPTKILLPNLKKMLNDLTILSFGKHTTLLDRSSPLLSHKSTTSYFKNKTFEKMLDCSLPLLSDQNITSYFEKILHDMSPLYSENILLSSTENKILDHSSFL